MQANSRYYVLGYYPPTHARDGRFHKIEVKTKRPGLRVAARKGYGSPRGRTAEERKRDEAARRAREAKRPNADKTSTELREILTSPLMQSGLNFTVHAAPFKNTQKEASVALAIEIDGDRLQYSAPDAKGMAANKIELSFYGISEHGKAMAGTRSVLDLTLRPETRERVKSFGVRVNPRISLPPGRYHLRIGARDEVAGMTGTVFYDLEVPDFRKEKLMLGGVVLASASGQQTPSIQPDPVLSKMMPAPPRAGASFRSATPSRSTRRFTTTSNRSRHAASTSPSECSRRAAPKCSRCATRWRTAASRRRNRGTFTATRKRLS